MKLMANWLIRLDPVNPQTTARMTTAFETWGRYDGDRQGLMRDALAKLKAAADAKHLFGILHVAQPPADRRAGPPLGSEAAVYTALPDGLCAGRRAGWKRAPRAAPVPRSRRF